MRWQDIISLSVISSRVKLLFLLVFLAILFAAILIYLEFMVKRKETQKEEKRGQDEFSKKMLGYKKLNKNPREKLELLDKEAKKYFRESFESASGKDYATLIELFRKLKLEEFSEFSIEMFSIYYGSGEVKDEKVNKAIDLFLKAVHKKNSQEKVKQKISAMERIEGFIEKRREAVIKKRIDKKINKDEKKLQKKIIKEKKIEEKNRKKKSKRYFQERRKLISKPAIKELPRVTTSSIPQKKKEEAKPKTKTSHRTLLPLRTRKKSQFEEERVEWNKEIKEKLAKIKELRTGGN